MADQLFKSVYEICKAKAAKVVPSITLLQKSKSKSRAL